MSNSIGVRSTVWSDCRISLRCGSICREPKSNGASAEAATVEKSATEARAATVFVKMASSPSLKDRIINFPCGSPPSPNKYYCSLTLQNRFSNIGAYGRLPARNVLYFPSGRLVCYVFRFQLSPLHYNKYLHVYIICLICLWPRLPHYRHEQFLYDWGKSFVLT